GNMPPPPQNPRGGGRPNDEKDKQQPSPFRHDSSLRPGIIVQCAMDASKLDAKLAEFASQHQTEVADLKEETNQTVASLRNSLLPIGLAPFAATAVGGLRVIRGGLPPLERLSDAVSRVSEKDFRLQLGKDRLPVELKPIAERLTLTLDQLRQA